MKRGVPEHFKTMRLADQLALDDRSCDRAEALGILEALCNHFAPRSAPQGNVGRCTNREIAVGCYSTRDPDHVVRALLAAGWLVEHDEHRLLIHDWEHHADEAVRKHLIRQRLPWLTPAGPLRVQVRTLSRRVETKRDAVEKIRDRVDPPRAGKGKGKGKEEGSLPESGGGVQGGRRSTRGGIAGLWPADFVLTDARREFAEAGGVAAAALEFGHFRDHHQARGSRFVDWDAAWRTWCRNAVKFAERRGRP